jgi:tRNA (guanine-N7-)-methyltransferase
VIDPSGLFPTPRPIWLEIGFGGGEHLISQAEAHPGVGLIGCEPFINGVARLLAEIDARGLENVRLVVDDARLLLEALPDQSLERIFVLFPDPWPKARHHKRRIVNPTTAAAFARLLVVGGELRLATDDPGYQRFMLETLLGRPGFGWRAERAADWRSRPADWPPTRYEQKARAAGRSPIFLSFERLAGGSRHP